MLQIWLLKLGIVTYVVVMRVATNITVKSAGVMGFVKDVGHVKTATNVIVTDTWVLWGLLQM